MTSLCPGTLFHSPGLNHHSTPAPPTDTPADIERKLKRVPFNGRDWPRESPVARVYDIGNTSTKMVLLNLKLKKKSQLRGLTDNNGEIVAPEPERHITDEPTTNWHFHRNCQNSSSAPYRPKIGLDLGWVNTQQRPPVTFDGGSHVNHRRHTSCGVSRESPVVGWNPRPHRPHTTSSMATEAELRSMGSMLNEPDLSLGERRYLYSIARIYSTGQMKQLKKDQYSQLLLRELVKGYHSPYEYERYYNYLNSPRKTQFGRIDAYRDDHRSQSVPLPADSHHDASGRRTQRGETSRSESKKRNKVAASSRSLQMSYTSSRTSMASGRQSQRSRGSKKTKSKSTPKDQQSQSPPSSPKRSTASEGEPAMPKSPRPVQRNKPEPVAAVAAANAEVVVDDDDDNVDSKTNDNDRYGEPEDSSRENDIRSTETSRQDADSPTEDESPRKGEENTEIPVEQTSEPVGYSSDPVKSSFGPVAKDYSQDEFDAERSEDKDERSSEGAGSNTNNTSSNTNNKLLAMIVSDAEREDASKEVKSSTGEETETPQEGMVKRFSSTELAEGYSPRANQEGSTRPLSRAGREDAIRERENSDDDCDDSDDEGGKFKQQPNKADSQTPQQEERRSSMDEKTNTARTENQEGERGSEEATTVGVEKRAGSPKDSDERAEDNHENEGRRSLIIPDTPRGEAGINGAVNQRASDINGSASQKATNEEVVDLSAESHNKDVDKIEY